MIKKVAPNRTLGKLKIHLTCRLFLNKKVQTLYCTTPTYFPMSLHLHIHIHIHIHIHLTTPTCNPESASAEQSDCLLEDELELEGVQRPLIRLDEEID